MKRSRTYFKIGCFLPAAVAIVITQSRVVFFVLSRQFSAYCVLTMATLLMTQTIGVCIDVNTDGHFGWFTLFETAYTTCAVLTAMLMSGCVGYATGIKLTACMTVSLLLCLAFYFMARGFWKSGNYRMYQTLMTIWHVAPCGWCFALLLAPKQDASLVVTIQ